MNQQPKNARVLLWGLAAALLLAAACREGTTGGHGRGVIAPVTAVWESSNWDEAIWQ
jgi:hypothetical protein